MHYFLLLFLYVLLNGCASPQPIIYPNERSASVDQSTIHKDISECKALAEQAGASSGNKATAVVADTAKSGAVGAASGAVGGAIAGSAGEGAAIGAASAATAGLIHGLFSESKPSSAYMAFVTRCLQDRGYEITGWE